ncbi:MAG TPA: DUF3330 domain-containing protein [Thiobacillaceae bacterium]|nr:DUF3330 domain-containing protein [Thiobacillaceae bacterium]
MHKHPDNFTPCGAPVLDCVSDDQCTVLTCDMCLMELPASEAIREEAADYVAHFCGLDCLELWRRKGSKRQAEQQKP